jgi:NAD(P)-dependent dehydrogenase (short-subunit alcohol dehydrogenase family)
MPKTVLVTGCSSGIGYAAATLFAAHGWKVAATMRSVERWNETVERSNIHLFSLDVTDEKSVLDAADQVRDRFGSLAVVVNNAGAGLASVFEVTPMSMIQEIFNINVFGPMRVMQAMLPIMTDGGRFINVTSATAIVPEPLLSIYSAAKCALSGFSEAVRYELAVRNIDLSVIEPGLIPGTNFMQSATALSSEVPMPTLYQDFVDRTMKIFSSKPSVQLASEEDVAEAIVSVAERGGAFRTPVGDDVQYCAEMRRAMGDEKYSSWTNNKYNFYNNSVN